MKANTKYLLPLLLSSAFCTAAHAQSAGTITIDGTVNIASCTPSVNGMGANGTVQLATVSTNHSLTGRTDFTIDLTGCAQSSLPARAYFYSNNASTIGWGGTAGVAGILLKTSGTGAGWGYRLTTGGGGQNFILTNSQTITPHPGDTGVTLSSGAATLRYNVSYVEQGSAYPIQPGTLNSQANYVIYFQ